MKKLLRSLFKPADTPPREETAHDTATTDDLGSESPPARSQEEVLGDLQRCLSSHSAEPLPVEEIDGSLPMYDAGYVTSIIAAELLNHIEVRYGLFVKGTDLIGRLQTLDELALHISESARSTESSRAE